MKKDSPLSFLSTIFIGIVSTTIFWAVLFSKTQKKFENYLVCFELIAGKSGTSQLFFDKGRGYNQEDSIRIFYANKGRPQEVIFSLPNRNISRIRLDPIDIQTEIQIKHPKLSSFLNTEFQTLKLNNENIFNGSLMITNDEKSDTYHIKANNDDCYVDIKLPKELEETKMSLFHFVSDYRTSIFISFIFFLIMAVNMPILFRIPEHKQRKKIFNYCILFLVLIFTFWYFANSPLSFLTFAKHDDQLFINLLRNLTEGCWLGTFNNLTLAKGPAFPLLLSTLYFFKIPIQIFYSLMAILTGIILYITCESYTRNPLIRGLVAVLVVFYPGLDFVRPLRDTYFYWMSILGILILLLNLKNLQKDILNRGQMLISGLIFGILIICREEWITLIFPVIVFILFFLLYKSVFSVKSELKIPFVKIFTLGLFLPSFLVSTINLHKYGSFITSDFKEKSFTRFLDNLQTIKTKGYTNNILISEEARNIAYQNSPRFALLKQYLDDKDAPLKGWQTFSTQAYPETKGDYGGNWLYWAIRDAVQLAGFYNSSYSAKKYYDSVSDELENAFKMHKITRSEKVVPIFPKITISQILKLPFFFKISLQRIVCLELPSVGVPESSGSNDEIADWSRLLNHNNIAVKNKQSAFFRDSNKWISSNGLYYQIKNLIQMFYRGFLAPLVLFGFLSFLWVTLKEKKHSDYYFILLLWVIPLARLMLICFLSANGWAAPLYHYLSYVGPLFTLSSCLSLLILKKKYDGRLIAYERK
jgi:hypothetical protein